MAQDGLARRLRMLDPLFTVLAPRFTGWGNIPDDRPLLFVGNHTIFANNATLAGHVSVDDWAILGGMTGVHQFCRIGAHSFCGAGTILLQDLPPYVICSGSPAVPRSINVEGLKRRGFSAEAIAEIRRAYKTLYRSELSLDEARSKIGEAALAVPELALLAAFIAESGRGLIR